MIKRFLFLLLLVAILAGALNQSAWAQARPQGTLNDPLSFLDDENPPNGAEDAASAPAPGGLGDWLRMFASLFFVLGLIVLAAWLFRRYGPRTIAQGGRGDAIHIVGSRPLGGRRSLMLVRVRGQTLLLGVTPQSIQCLTEIHELDGEWAQPPDTTSEIAEKLPASGFGKELERRISSRPASKRIFPDNAE